MSATRYVACACGNELHADNLPCVHCDRPCSIKLCAACKRLQLNTRP